MSDPSIAASDPARSVWVAANAGAGKTYTLANRVTRLLLGICQSLLSAYRLTGGTTPKAIDRQAQP